jgi:hypothetical protein
MSGAVPSLLAAIALAALQHRGHVFNAHDGRSKVTSRNFMDPLTPAPVSG